MEEFCLIAVLFKTSSTLEGQHLPSKKFPPFKKSLAKIDKDALCGWSFCLPSIGARQKLLGLLLADLLSGNFFATYFLVMFVPNGPHSGRQG